MTKVVALDKSKRVVLVDGGYLLFYRWHATERWISFQKNFGEVDDAKRVELFAAHLESQLKKLGKSLKAPTGNFVFCMDSHSWRHQIMDGYKGTRCSEICRDVYPVYESVLEKYGSVVRVESLEADDLIAVILRKLPLDTAVTILTSDHDFLQLQRDGLDILNATLKPVVGLSPDPVVSLWAKIFMGDPSDNIPPAVPRCGKKTALKLAEDPVQRLATAEKYADAVKRNRQLIDLSMIPLELVEAFEKQLQIAV